MKRIVFVLGLLVGCAVFGAMPTISGVTAQQRYPWNGKVDISYTVSGDVNSHCKNYGLIPSLKVTATDKVANKTYTATKLSGDTALTAGTHKLVWDLDAQGLAIKSANVIFSVACDTTEATYCVIDLSAGSSATSYPVTYLASEPSGGFNVNEYKTTKLVLKRIKAGSFIMGEDQSNQSHKVTLTKPFFMGIFEVTKKQWMLVMGSSPTPYVRSDDQPADGGISYDEIRGYPDSIYSSSFCDRLQTRTGINFDLPTEAQWEYACRAGTTTAYSYGNTANGDYMWYSENSGSKTHSVGTKKPNPWGLYDMHGNVCELCLDWYNTLRYGTDPKGYNGGTQHVVERDVDNRKSFCRRGIYYGGSGDFTGFRLSRTLP